MRCSVIIPARNAQRTIGDCILAVLGQTVPRDQYEVVVVDDGSIDRTILVARRSGAKIIARPALGPGAARNAGAKATDADVLVFLDPDCVPRVDWLAQMLAPFDDPRVAGVRGACLTHQKGLLPRLIQAEYDDSYRRMERKGAIDVVEGFSAAYRRDGFLAVGGFDPSFVAAGDVDLSYRMAARGRLVFAPKAIVYRDHGTSFQRYVERNLREGLWRTLVLARHPAKLRHPSSEAPELRTQVPLAGLSAASLLIGLRWRAALPLAGLLVAAFTTTAAPSAWRARRAGADVALASPGLSLARGVAMALGATIGGGAILTQKLLHAGRGRG